jgi:predicted nucleic acid-binding protein
VADLFALDTNVYLRAVRDPGARVRLKRFLLRGGHRVRLSAVVGLELRAGARTPAQQRAVDALLSPYASRDRLVVPSFEAFTQAGRVIAALAARERRTQPAPSFTNDALLATSCRESGVVLVTEDHGDFAAIQRHLRGFRFVAPDGVLA